jgi:hypothetical protein
MIHPYDFDGNGLLTQIADPPNSVRPNSVRQVAFDGGLQPTAVTDLSTRGPITFEYDAPGQIARVVEGGCGAVTRLSYLNGKVTDVVVKDALGTAHRELSFLYDSQGCISQMLRDNVGRPTSSHAGRRIRRCGDRAPLCSARSRPSSTNS